MQLLSLAVVFLVACAPRSLPPVTSSPPITSPPPAASASPQAVSSSIDASMNDPMSASVVPPSTWLELGGARMLITTTRAAHSRRADPSLPLLVVLPWARSTPAELLAEVGYVELDEPARVVAIQGFEPDGDGFSWWRRPRPAPTPADPDRDDELVRLLADRAARLANLLTALQTHFGAAKPPVVSGVSQGGDLSIALAVHHPASISAALPIAARFPSPLWPAPAAASPHEAPPVDAFHGADDPVAPLASLERAFTALRAAGLGGQLHAYPGVTHEIAPTLRTDLLACAALRLRGSLQPCAVQIKN